MFTYPSCSVTSMVTGSSGSVWLGKVGGTAWPFSTTGATRWIIQKKFCCCFSESLVKTDNTITKKRATLSMVSYNDGQKQLRHSPQKYPVSLKTSFSTSNFHISTPSPLFNVVTMWQYPLSILHHWEGGRGCLAIDKKDLFCNYGRTLIENVCSAQMCQHALLSMIVVVL